MSCNSCTECCKVLSLPVGTWEKILIPGRISDSEFMRKYWKPVSKRIAKKLNPHLISQESHEKEYVTCRALGPDGCTQYEDRPHTCKLYTGSYYYTFDCNLNMIPLVNI